MKQTTEKDDDDDIRDIFKNASWIRKKNEDGKYKNLNDTAKQAGINLRSLEALTKVITVSLSAAALGSMIAIKTTFISQGIDSLMNHQYTSVEDAGLNYTGLKEDYAKAHEAAPYKKFMTITIIGANMFFLLGQTNKLIGRRRHESENSSPKNNP